MFIRFGRLICMVLLTCIVSTSVRSEDAEGIDVGLTKQLFLDDYVIDKIEGGRKVLNQPRRHSEEPMIRPEHPWEGAVVVSPRVVWDEEKNFFHMYYTAHYDKDDRIFTCYARSDDGIHWVKPTLGLHEGPDGTRKNNIVLRGEGRQARMRYVSLNPYARDRGERFVTLYVDNVPGLTEFVGYSPDGIHWRTTIKIGDLRNSAAGPGTANPRFFLIEQKWDARKADYRYRSIWRSESADLEHWGGGRWIVGRDEGDGPNLEFYHASSHFLGSQTYHGLHVGYLYPYRTAPEGKKLEDGVRMAGTIETELMVSRDTLSWRRVDRQRAFFPLGESGRWDAGMVFVEPEVVAGDELRFYYGGWALDHAVEKNRGAIGLATLRLDGFVHVEPKTDKATIVTKPFKLAGDRLIVNADARRGAVRIALLDTAGKELPGFEAATCRAIREDGLRQTVVWGSTGSLSAVRGKTIRLRFELTGKAKLYAFGFVSG